MRLGIDARYAADPATGVGRYSQNLLRALAALELPREVVLFQADARGAAPTMPARWRRVTVRAPARLAWEQIALPPVLERQNLDLFHGVRDVGLPLLGATRRVVTVYDLIPWRFARDYLPNPAHRLYYTTMIRLGARRARRILTISEAARQDIVRWLGVPVERIAVTLLAVDERFTPQAAPADGERLRARYGLPTRFFLGVGSPEPRKNVRLLLRAFARLLRRQPDARLVLMGSRWRNRDVRPLLAQLDLAERVTVCERVADEDLPALYRAATAFIFPSRHEGFGLPPLEALACGTPVVAARTSSLPEVLGDAALWIAPDDAEGLASVLEQLRDTPALRQRLGEGGPAQAARFTWERTAQATLRAYGQAVAE